jgi:hypothetical protein
MRADDPAEPADRTELVPRDPSALGPDLAAAAGALRDEWRLDEEEYTRAAVQQWTHSRGLIDVARDLLHRGDVVALDLGAKTFTGTIVDVGDDFLRLRTAGGVIDVALQLLVESTPGRRGPRLVAPVVLRVLQRVRKGGRRGNAGASTLRARLLEYEADEVEVVVGSPLLRDELRGALTVGRDFVAVQARGAEPAFLPIAWVTWVARWAE